MNLTSLHRRIIWICLATTCLVLLCLTLLSYRRLDVHASVASAQAPVVPASRTGVNTLRYPSGAPQLSSIQAQTLNVSAMPLSDILSARIAYDEDATARVGTNISGRILSLHAQVGDTVKANQTLAQIDSPDLGNAISDVQKAKADEQRKRMALTRARELVPGEAISKRDWESVQADYEQAVAETARTQLRIKNLNPANLPIRGERMQLISPLSGVVVERTANPGMEINPGLPAPLFVVTDPTRLSLLIDVPERIVSQIKVGAKVQVESDAFTDQMFTATITQLGRTVDPNTRRVTVRAKLMNPEQKLLPEMFVRALVLQEYGQGVRVPNSSIVFEGVNTYLYVRTSPTEFERRQIKLAQRGSEHSYVISGLKSGEQVVTGGALLLDAELTARGSSAS